MSELGFRYELLRIAYKFFALTDTIVNCKTYEMLEIVFNA